MSDSYTIKDYQDAMVQARQERDNYSDQLLNASIDAYEWMDELARALGIQTGRESWWDSGEEERRTKILEKIALIKYKSLDKIP